MPTTESYSLQGGLDALIAGRIPFTLHYPGQESAVVTISERLSHAQLVIAVNLGGVYGAGGVIQILFSKLT